MARDFSVSDLIRTAEALKLNGQKNSVEMLYRTWVEHNQDHPLLYAILFNYSVVLSDENKLDEAQSTLEKAIALNADFMPAYINLGRIYERKGRVGLAIIEWSMAIDRMAAVNGPAITHKTTALNQSARALEQANKDEAAEQLLAQSLEIDPRQREDIQHLIALRQRQCKWPVLQPTERLERTALMEGISPLSAAAYTDDPMLQLAIADHYNKLDVGILHSAMTRWPRALKTDGPLRIGYLSSDLREHAVGYLMTEVLAQHDRSKVEIFAYYCGPEANDPLHLHFKDSVDHWVPINHLDDEAAAQRIADDGIQILVDLNGYTREARLKVVARRPAPIIVNWLGFPGSMASPYHHYIIADDWIIPPASEMFYSEKVLRLPCYQPSARDRKVADRPVSRKESGLPEDAVVYCCFNGAHKINRFTFDRWLMILERVPKSVLWLLGSNEETDKRLQDYAVQRGIAADRIIYATKLANPYHLARYVLADLFLDTTPYGAHTTASDALWMGVPVLTLSGRSFASRVCGSLTRAAGIPELVTGTPEEFVDRAVELGNAPVKLKAFRERLRRTHDTATLFDLPLLVRKLEGLYGQMWKDLEQNRLPKPDLANLEVYLQVGSQVDHEELEVQSIPDYRGWWTDLLSERHPFRPVTADRRLAASFADPAKPLSDEAWRTVAKEERVLRPVPVLC
jgi:predicted O-linked N-acetylglucosamine transferase (SPINDLY family)